MSKRAFCQLSRAALTAVVAGLCAVLLVTGAVAKDKNKDKHGHGSVDVVRPKGYTPPVYRGGLYHYTAVPVVKPLNYGHWVFKHYDSGFDHRSAYFHFGLFPYVEAARIHVLPYVTVAYIGAPIILQGGGYYLSRSSSADTPVSGTLSDIRSAWMGGRADLIKSHVDGSKQIAVLLDGKYDYSVDASDYIDMTTDAIGQLHTTSFTWEEVRKRADGDYAAFGKHVYRDSSNQEKTVYVSYTLMPVKHGKFMITEVGSSENPLN